MRENSTRQPPDHGTTLLFLAGLMVILVATCGGLTFSITYGFRAAMVATGGDL